MLSEKEYYDHELATYWEEAEDDAARRECSSAVAVRPYRPQVKSSAYRRLRSAFRQLMGGAIISTRSMPMSGKRLAG